jgi:metal-responsive CopG/Arc/MetJ family transcriptional regulator
LIALLAAQQRSRDAIIRDAVAAYLSEHRRKARDKTFGIWGDLEVDGLEYQRKLREEW